MELRLHIFQPCLNVGEPIRICDTDEGSQHHALMQTSRQIRSESLRVFYSCNVLKIEAADYASCCKEWLLQTAPWLSNLKTLEFECRVHSHCGAEARCRRSDLERASR